jgi:hypothetical protein
MSALVGGLVALAAVLAYPFGLRADEASAVAWVAKNRGKITRDDKRKDRPVVGVDLFNYQYNLMGKRVPDAELKELASFPNCLVAGHTRRSQVWHQRGRRLR